MTQCRMLASSALLASLLALGAVSSASANMDDCHMGEFGKHRAERLEQHHQKLHDALKLKPEQEGAWKKLMASEPHMARPDAARREDGAKLTTPERADRMLERMKDREARMTEHVAALKEFYGALSPEQKKTFDDFHAAPREGMRGKARRNAQPEGEARKP